VELSTGAYLKTGRSNRLIRRGTELVRKHPGTQLVPVWRSDHYRTQRILEHELHELMKRFNGGQRLPLDKIRPMQDHLVPAFRRYRDRFFGSQSSASSVCLEQSQ
jgi:hypothetical protein